MTTTINIDRNYSYVLLAATGTFVLNLVHGINVSKHRRIAGVNYPAAYSPSSRTDKAAMCFDSAQRAHCNYIENQLSTVGAMLIAGIRYPITASVMGTSWMVCRWLYMTGYSRGEENGKGRIQGLGSFIFQYILVIMSGYTSLAILRDF
ncbi:Microsomal glutathione S-transferase 3 [Golovinomyces cichoracearum]|uniref:Microsomal glutathione S-transferase 3 n=1 Tax=Golovinomyces cichoracearum TaxID=62708 RepID=A0A420J110_9PEZI|nr:Microsomal glutathione S-transferase 3 [Golovinomyces cichoracearum]